MPILDWRARGGRSDVDATSVIMHIDVEIVIITLVAYVRLHHRDATSVIMRVGVEIVSITLVALSCWRAYATSVIITIFTSTHIITLVASQ